MGTRIVLSLLVKLYWFVSKDSLEVLACVNSSRKFTISNEFLFVQNTCALECVLPFCGKRSRLSILVFSSLFNVKNLVRGKSSIPYRIFVLGVKWRFIKTTVVVKLSKALIKNYFPQFRITEMWKKISFSSFLINT